MSNATLVANTPRKLVGRYWQRASRVDPRYLIAFLITVVLVAAQLRYQMVGGYARLVLALAVCTLTETLLSWFDRGKIVNLLSAYISGISLTLLIKPQGGALWPFIIGGVLAISSKYVLRYRDNHLWNPTNFAVSALLLAAPGSVSVLSHQFGNDLVTNLVIWTFGLIIVARVGVLHITLTYVASFLLLNSIRALAVGQPLLPEIAPITGPMYQLFIFFMITDPRTIVRGRWRQITVAALVAVMEMLIRLGGDNAWPLPTAFTAAPAFLALALVGPVAKWLDLRRIGSGTIRPALAMAVLPLVLLAGCDTGKRDAQIFELLDPKQTGVTFANTITTNDSVNVQTDVYIYNGAGVAIGDIDNDGLSDIFFTGNMVSSRLYSNKGGMRFEDITTQARVSTDRWATGATMADVNDDGYLDIYVSVSGPEWSRPEQRANLLFINNGDRTFTEAAVRYGIADTGFTTHGVFLDYDRDGCLDLFLLNNSPRDFSRGVENHPTGVRGQTPDSYNQLYRNNCRGGKEASFANVSSQAGILRDAGYGLGAVVSDLNGDGWPDIYVSNDGIPNDVLYVNNGDGTFTDKAARWLKHTSAAGMGVDIADFNNDGRPDILQVDMMPRDMNRRKRMSGFTTYGTLVESRSRGFRDDYSANALQLSNGITNDGDVIFSEIGRLAGVAHTDWSWSALFADFDNDGYKDIFISNGYPKAVNDLDYQKTMFPLRRLNNAASRRGRLELLNSLPGYKEPNYVFRNAGNLTFSDRTREWGMDHPSFSYGAAYADLDKDGRLDLVVNNIDAPAFIYHNVAPDDDAHHYLEIKLEGESPQRAIGSKLVLTAGGQKQYIYYTPYRGYMSTMDDWAHFGLGRARKVDSLEVEWPDGRYQLLTNLDVDRRLVVKKAHAPGNNAPGGSPPSRARAFVTSDSQLFQPDAPGLVYKHRTATQVDYNLQPLLPYMVSRQGPSVAAGDVDGDGLDDVFVGGGSGLPGRLFIQEKKSGSFVESTQEQPWHADREHEDWGATFFDANGDGRLDLYVASGGYHLTPSSPLLQDRLYLNAGGGRFVRDAGALPTMLTSTGVVQAADFTGDGKPDLFIAGRLTPRKYPYPTRSYLLRNDGGRFTDVTDAVAPELARPGGMITDAAWIDFDGDKRLDLITVGEWMPIQFFRNDGKTFRNVSGSTGLPPLRGWWYSIATGDFDKDGRPDLVAGNLGLNHTYTTSQDSRFGVYASNFTGNQTTDVVLTQATGGTEYPFAGLASLGRGIYWLGLRYPTYGSFAEASVRQVFSPAQLQQAVHYQTDSFASLYIRNSGGGKFESAALPNEAQISPIKGIIAHDVDRDGHLDIVVAGNIYDTEPNIPRADAGNGLWLRGNGRGQFTPVSPVESGFLAPLNVASLTLINTPIGKSVVIGNTGDSIQTFRIRKR